MNGMLPAEPSRPDGQQEIEEKQRRSLPRGNLMAPPTLSAAFDKWIEITADSAPEAKQHIRELCARAALPTLRTRLTDGLVARFVVGMLSGNNHAAAAQAALRILATDFVTFSNHEILLPALTVGSGAVPTLGEALTRIAYMIRHFEQPLLSLQQLAVSVDGTQATAILRATDWNMYSGYAGPREISDDPAAVVFPIRRVAIMEGRVFSTLAKMTIETVSDLSLAVQRELMTAHNVAGTAIQAA